jgi:predicted ATPase
MQRIDRAHLLIEEADALGEPVEDPLLLYSVLYGFSIANYVAFDADALRKTTTKLLELAQQQGVVWYLLTLAAATAELGQLDDAWRHLEDAKAALARQEIWCEAEINRVAGELTLIGAKLDPQKAELCFERALAVARQQQAKSWELRAAMSLARLWRDQSKVRQARELLAPVYGWFTEGFDTRDLKEAKALLEELAA